MPPPHAQGSFGACGSLATCQVTCHAPGGNCGVGLFGPRDRDQPRTHLCPCKSPFTPLCATALCAAAVCAALAWQLPLCPPFTQTPSTGSVRDAMQLPYAASRIDDKDSRVLLLCLRQHCSPGGGLPCWPQCCRRAHVPFTYQRQGSPSEAGQGWLAVRKQDEVTGYLQQGGGTLSS